MREYRSTADKYERREFMGRRKFMILLSLVLAAAFTWGVDRPAADAAPCPAPFNIIDPVSGYCFPDHFTKVGS